MSTYVIKYGNRLYLAKNWSWMWTHLEIFAEAFSKTGAEATLRYLHRDTGLYEARIVPMSDIAVVVESVP